LNVPWANAVAPLLELERRGGKLYLPGSAPSLGGREEDALRLEAEVAEHGFAKVEDAELARFLESAGRIHRVGDGFAVSRDLYERGAETIQTLTPITLAGFRDALGISRRVAQLLLERYDADGLTRRVGDERVLRRAARR
jgi:selenocysteine-specific elongation factor